MSATFERVQQVELRVKKAALLIEKQRKELEELKRNLALVSAHNEELQKYADSYKEDTKLIEESISKSLEMLDSIEGLEELDTLDIEDAAAADSFQGGEAIVEDNEILDIDNL